MDAKELIRTIKLLGCGFVLSLVYAYYSFGYPEMIKYMSMGFGAIFCLGIIFYLLVKELEKLR